MKTEIIVVTGAYGTDTVKQHGGQRALLPIIAGAGADGVEIRRELLRRRRTGQPAGPGARDRSPAAVRRLLRP